MNDRELRYIYEVEQRNSDAKEQLELSIISQFTYDVVTQLPLKVMRLGLQSISAYCDYPEKLEFHMLGNSDSINELRILKAKITELRG